jgi:hypothetical protein
MEIGLWTSVCVKEESEEDPSFRRNEQTVRISRKFNLEARPYVRHTTGRRGVARIREINRNAKHGFKTLEHRTE